LGFKKEKIPITKIKLDNGNISDNWRCINILEVVVVMLVTN